MANGFPLNVPACPNGKENEISNAIINAGAKNAYPVLVTEGVKQIFE